MEDDLQKYKKWNTTSKKKPKKMEDDLKKNEKWKTTSKNIKNGRQPQKK
jgi:hypothetical protein